MQQHAGANTNSAQKIEISNVCNCNMNTASCVHCMVVFRQNQKYVSDMAACVVHMLECVNYMYACALLHYNYLMVSLSVLLCI